MGKLLGPHLREHLGAALAIITLQIMQAIAALTLPTLNADIIDQGVMKADVSYIWRTGAVMLGITAVQMVAAIGSTILAARTAAAIGAKIRTQMFTQVQKFSTGELNSFTPASLITRGTNDVQQIQMLVLFSFSLLIMAPAMGIGGVIMAIRQDLGLSALLLVILPILAAFMVGMALTLQPKFRLMQNRIDAINRVMREQLTGVRVIRAYVRQDYQASRFSLVNTDLRKTATSIGRVFALMFPVVQIIINVSSIAVVWFGASRIDSGQMQVGSLIAFLSYLMQILFAVMMATMVMMMLPRAQVSGRRIQNVLTTVPAIDRATSPVELPAKKLTFEVDGVDFTYPGAEAPVLSGIDLTLTPGKVTALIGPTGCGKTTLCQLLPRLADPTSGTVRAGGVDLRDTDLEDLRSRIAFVAQRAYLFSGTIASNIDPAGTATDEDIWQTLEWAQGADFVRKLDNGLQSEVNQGGHNFSGGQRQRLSMARAFLRAADLYIFDDSFSALDYATDARVRAGLPEATRGAAVLIVAQRVATIRHVDEIIVLDHSRIVGRGTHSELMESCAQYQDIVRSQLSEQEAA